MQPERIYTTAPRPRRSFAGEALRTVAIVAIVVAITRVFFSPFEVDGRSMTPSLQDQERIFVNRAQFLAIDVGGWLDRLPYVTVDADWTWRPFGMPDRGDIVVLDPPASSDDPYIKRVIGLPGETVTFADGRVLIDGVPLDEPYLAEMDTTCRGSWCAMGPIPDGMVYVLGDNRNNSADSRAFGPVAIDHLVGQAWFVNWPISLFGLIRDVDYEAAAD